MYLLILLFSIPTHFLTYPKKSNFVILNFKKLSKRSQINYFSGDSGSGSLAIFIFNVDPQPRTLISPFSQKIQIFNGNQQY